jgi:hypothetical protein
VADAMASFEEEVVAKSVTVVVTGLLGEEECKMGMLIESSVKYFNEYDKHRVKL